MQTRVAMLAFGAVTSIATWASAADPWKPPPGTTGMPEFGWAGFYLGIHGGAGAGVSLDSEEPAVPLDGEFVGLQIGFNAIVGNNFMLGIEGGLSSGGLAGLVQYVDAEPILGPVTLTEQIHWIASIRGRAGWVMGDWMPYVTAGWARADSTRTTGFMQTITLGHSGWTAGAGIEWMFAPHWTLRAEYKYYSFGPMTYEWAIGGPSIVNFNFSTAEIGLNYKF